VIAFTDIDIISISIHICCPLEILHKFPTGASPEIAWLSVFAKLTSAFVFFA
jgi:hypothetical protein